MPETASSERRSGDPQLEPDVLVPQFWMGGREGLEQADAGRVVEHDDLDAQLLEPFVAAAEGFCLANDDGADVELSDEPRAVPTRRQGRDHHAVRVVPSPAGFAEGIGFGVDGRIVLLDSAVMPCAEQRSISVEEGSADWNAALALAEFCLGVGDGQHLLGELSREWSSIGLRHAPQYARLVTLSTYHAQIGTQEVDLPIASMSKDLALALLITVDMGMAFMEQAGSELAELLRPFDVDVVATVATMGIPVAVEVTRALGLEQYVVLHKTQKIHLADAIAEPVRSITTAGEQKLLYDRARIDAVADKRIAIVDDVVSTGASTGAALRLFKRIGADVVVIGTLVTEASIWRTSLGEDAVKVRALGSIPVFRPDGAGGLVEDWEG
jgi:adenine/guanine phosphoribosyltransferase-like PRPP-binding protein